MEGFRRICLSVLRNIKKKKTSSAIMICSISIGLSIAVILFGFIERENKTDSFHKEKELIYRLLSNDPFEDSGTLAFINKDASKHVLNFPEVNMVCKVTELSGNGVLLQYENSVFEKNMVVGADENFFELFDFNFFDGNEKKSLEPYTIVITNALAQKIFGRTNVRGEEVILQLDTIKVSLTVFGVLEETEENTHFNFDAVVPFSTFNSLLQGSSTYLLLNPNSDKSLLEDKLSKDPVMPSLIGPGKCDYYLQNLVNVYFDETNERKFTKTRNHIFIIVSWIIIFFILVIALFNFINLFAISLIERKKQFGVKKVLGATASDISASIGIEVVVYLSIALILSMISILLIMPLFNQIFDSSLTFTYFLNKEILIGLGLLFIGLTAVISGVLSLFLNKIKPVSLMVDSFQLKFKMNKIFFTLQFVISTTLIFCCIVVIKQTGYIKEKSLGFNRDIMELKVPKGEKSGNMNVFKQKLAQHRLFTNDRLSVASGNPISGNYVIRYDLEDGSFYMPYFLEGDAELLSTLELEIKTGLLHRSVSAHDKIVNEKFLKYFDIEDPIGASIPGTSGDRIIGVVSDFNVASLKKEIPLYIIGYTEEAPRLLINYSGLEFEEVRSTVGDIWNQIFPYFPFNYALLSDELLLKHKEDFFFSRIIIAFAMLSIIISCFGLFSLAQNNSQKKGKEIAIRKIMGASAVSIVTLLFLDFGKWIALSFLIAAVVGYFAIQNWLETFIYRTDVGWQVFAGTAFVTCVMSLLAISIQTVKAAVTNPVHRLRYE